METKFRFFYDDKNKPVVTVCDLSSDHGTTRGVAICSERDTPCKKTGRRISYQRAEYAQKVLTRSLPKKRQPNCLNVLRPEALQILESAGCENLMVKSGVHIQ